jgi:hypothetical protein
LRWSPPGELSDSPSRCAPSAGLPEPRASLGQDASFPAGAPGAGDAASVRFSLAGSTGQFGSAGRWRGAAPGRR